MSEDNEHEHEHEHQHPFPFVQFLVGPPPEAVERMKLEALANAHEMHHFINGLDETELMKLIDLIKVVSADGAAAYYYIGVLANKLDVQHGKCMSCGLKHDEELAELAGDGGPVNLNPLNKPVVQNFTGTPRPTPGSPEEKGDPNDPVGPRGSDKYNENMVNFGMEADDDGSDRVMCTACGKWYENLADRMVKPAGVAGCPGCIQKNKWG